MHARGPSIVTPHAIVLFGCYPFDGKTFIGLFPCLPQTRDFEFFVDVFWDTVFVVRLLFHHEKHDYLRNTHKICFFIFMSPITLYNVPLTLWLKEVNDFEKLLPDFRISGS